MYLQLLTSVPSVRLHYNLKPVFVEIFGGESLAPWTLQEAPLQVRRYARHAQKPTQRSFGCGYAALCPQAKTI